MVRFVETLGEIIIAFAEFRLFRIRFSELVFQVDDLTTEAFLDSLEVVDQDRETISKAWDLELEVSPRGLGVNQCHTPKRDHHTPKKKKKLRLPEPS